MGNKKYSGRYPPAEAGSNKPYHGMAGFFLRRGLYAEFIFEE